MKLPEGRPAPSTPPARDKLRRPEPAPRPAPQTSPGRSAESPLSVDDLSAALKDVVAGSFPSLWVEGEVTQFTAHRNGHWYFSLKGERASIRCVVWASTARWLPASPDEGMRVVLMGQLDLYAARTELQFIVSRLTSAGDGLWRKAFEATRRALEADGLLDPARKRRLPYFPRCVAVVTSADGAAFRDVVATVQRRNPLVEIVLIPATVQGQEAATSLARAIARMARWGGADVVIIGRGGGSREDLWSFNDERLARRIAACPVPVVSAVGHEIDTTICDLVADFRAATPTAAAEVAVPRLEDVRGVESSLRRRLAEALSGRSRSARQRLESTGRRVSVGAGRVLEQRRLRLAGTVGKLHALSPLLTLSRGYSVVTDSAGLVVTSVARVRAGELLDIRVTDGRIRARAEDTDRIEGTGGEVAE